MCYVANFMVWYKYACSSNREWFANCIFWYTICTYIVGVVILENEKNMPVKVKVSMRILQIFGDSLYMTHYIVMLIVNYFFEMINITQPVLKFFLVVVICIIVGQIAYYVVEKPLTRKLLQKNIKRQRIDK